VFIFLSFIIIRSFLGAPTPLSRVCTVAVYPYACTHTQKPLNEFPQYVILDNFTKELRPNLYLNCAVLTAILHEYLSAFLCASRAKIAK
jgi:hypothetical protein